MSAQNCPKWRQQKMGAALSGRMSALAGTNRMPTLTDVEARLLSMGYAITAVLALPQHQGGIGHDFIVEVADKDTAEPRGWRTVNKFPGRDWFVARTDMKTVLRIRATATRIRKEVA